MTAPDVLAFAEAAALAEEVASVVRHDLRNHLAIMRGAAYYLRRRTKDTEAWAQDPRMAQFFATMEGEIDNATILLNDRLSFGEVWSRCPEPNDVVECVRLAARCVRPAPNHHVHVELGVRTATVCVDPMEVSLALRCLIENAVEATPDGGVVEVMGGPHGSDVAIVVKDAGPGLDEQEAERVMAPFVTTKTGHRGLGLNIARRICRRYRGNLTIHKLPVGTAVSMTLPREGAARRFAERARD